ncbi:Hypothetical protein SRAE_X000171000 [Strongyloides ratti]|uniref:Uncharacterized protein n=1 Tax=Strongyloides ratti TaxID=34506 RepID=A0A090KXH7_STRRB|nr:Hypothetical protein SRAE_X000171000 [Strongyloides ratti]CEF59968.1 Hypothetical protein SRAE_X000171000 [Strongyloides ratti]
MNMNKKDNNQVGKISNKNKEMYENDTNKININILPSNEIFCCICGKKCHNLSKISKRLNDKNNAVFGRIFHILNVEWPSVRDRYSKKKSTMPSFEFAKHA